MDNDRQMEIIVTGLIRVALVHTQLETDYRDTANGVTILHTDRQTDRQINMSSGTTLSNITTTWFIDLYLFVIEQLKV